MKILRSAPLGVIALVLSLRTQALAVWPPSTAFTEETTSMIYGLIIVVFVAGIVIGIMSQRNRHEHK